MKLNSLRIMVVALLGSLLLAGCQNEGAQLTAPEDPAVASTPTFIELPTEPDLGKALYDEEWISKTYGGDLKVYYASYYSSLRVYINVHFEPGSYSEDFRASLSTDTGYLTTNMALTFGPHGKDFLKPARLTIKASGLNLWTFKTYDKDSDGIVTLNFYYTSTTSGQWEKMSGAVKVNISQGTLEASNIELPHFSRYAFGI